MQMILLNDLFNLTELTFPGNCVSGHVRDFPLGNPSLFWLQEFLFRHLYWWALCCKIWCGSILDLQQNGELQHVLLLLLLLTMMVMTCSTVYEHLFIFYVTSGAAYRCWGLTVHLLAVCVSASHLFVCHCSFGTEIPTNSGNSFFFFISSDQYRNSRQQHIQRSKWGQILLNLVVMPNRPPYYLQQIIVRHISAHPQSDTASD